VAVPGWGFGVRAVLDRKAILENGGLENLTYFIT